MYVYIERERKRYVFLLDSDAHIDHRDSDFNVGEIEIEIYRCY